MSFGSRVSGRVSGCSVSESGFEIAIAGGMCDVRDMCVHAFRFVRARDREKGSQSKSKTSNKLTIGHSW